MIDIISTLIGDLSPEFEWLYGLFALFVVMYLCFMFMNIFKALFSGLFERKL